MKPIRVLQIVSSLNRGSGIMGIIMNLYKHIDRDKVQFDFLYFVEYPSSYKEEIQDLGGEVFYIPMLNAFNFMQFRKSIIDFFQKQIGMYKVLHLHEILLGFIILPLAKRYGINTRIVHSHNSEPSDKKIKNWRNRLLCLPLKTYATDFFACSRKAGIFLYGENFMDKVVLINNAVDSEKYAYNPLLREELRQELKLGNKFVVGHIGRFCNQKNHLFLLKVFTMLQREKNDSCLLLVGDGEQRNSIEKEVDRLGLTSNVVFLGIRSDIDKILQVMDVFVLPSLFEGLPVVGVEAQAAGLPCVISDSITQEMKITDDVYFLSLQNSIDEWIEMILYAKNHCTRKNTACIIKSKGYDIDAQAKRIENFYRIRTKE